MSTHQGDASRECVTKALDLKPLDRIPLDVQTDVGIETDILRPSFVYPPGRSTGGPGRKGSYLDAWGCKWECAEDGVKGEVKEGIIEEWSDLDGFLPPFEVIEDAELGEVNRQCASSDKFVMKMWGIEPFQRMQYLRGTETFLMDLMDQEPALFRLRDMVHEYYLREIELWVKSDIDGIQIEDDWGSQQSLLINPRLWRSFFKPLYKEYCDLARAHGKRILLHSDGYVAEIIPDLIEIGFHALNLQLDCMPLEQLAEDFCGKICFWGGFDRQQLLPFGTPEECRTEALRLANVLLAQNASGFVGSVLFDKDARMPNIKAVYAAWNAFPLSTAMPSRFPQTTPRKN